MNKATYDPTASAEMSTIVRAAVIVTTLALFAGSMVNAALGLRDVAVLLALGASLGMSAWGFVHAGHNEAALALLCCVLVTVVTLILVLTPLGVHDMAVAAYGGVVLFGALLLRRRAFLAVAGFTVFAATCAFLLDLNGLSRSVVARSSGWTQYLEFLAITAAFAVLGRIVAEKLFTSLGEAHRAAELDHLTGLMNRAGFLMAAAMRLSAAHAKGEGGVLVVADLDGFRRTNLVVGHQAADNILREAARRIQAVHATALVARAGDDEFAVLGIGVPEGEAAAFARRVHAALDFDYMGVSVRNAAGYSRFPRDASGIESLMMGAQSGVAQAKTLEADRFSGPADRI